MASTHEKNGWECFFCDTNPNPRRSIFVPRRNTLLSNFQTLFTFYNSWDGWDGWDGCDALVFVMVVMLITVITVVTVIIVIIVIQFSGRSLYMGWLGDGYVTVPYITTVPNCSSSGNHSGTVNGFPAGSTNAVLGLVPVARI